MRQKRKKGYYVQVQVVEGFIDNERVIGKSEDVVGIVVEDLVDRKGKILLRAAPDIAVIKTSDEFVKQLEGQVELIQQKIKVIRKDKDGSADQGKLDL